jgi:hypothetical protein
LARKTKKPRQQRMGLNQRPRIRREGCKREAYEKNDVGWKTMVALQGNITKSKKTLKNQWVSR